MRQHLVLIGVILLAGCWFFGVLWAYAAGWVGRDGIEWWLLAVVPLIGVVAVAFRNHRRQSQESGPWDDHRVIRRLVVQAEGAEDVTLVMELERHFDAGSALRMEFRGIAGLQLAQFCGDVLSFSSLRCQETPRRRDGLRYHVFDPHNDSLRFRCREIVQASAEADV